MAEVRVRFYGSFRNITGKEMDSIQLDQATLEGLVQAIETAYGQGFTQVLRDPQQKLSPGMMVLVNGKQFTGWQTLLSEGDDVTFMSAIAGGGPPSEALPTDTPHRKATRGGLSYGLVGVAACPGIRLHRYNLR
ncbi:MAG: MoaD/ThiS family protein [Dehalococcoidia bacterium]|jgi:MoaD family protein|nr:MoaD/ThiS family protein [Dehalococcoidia bacterium]MDP6510110.1 MoaD/ThiS family protein [Dehalococcoidia bacterium]MDP6782017.1 MoaD/ThiS family protein [Dehalococcoidia bacterium]